MKRLICACMILILAFPLLSATLNNSDTSLISDSGNKNFEISSPHAAIEIDNEGDFNWYVFNEGWDGSGTPSDPYIIENYEFSDDFV